MTVLYIVSLPTSTGFLPEQQRYTSSHCPPQQGSSQSNSVIHRLIANLNRVPARATALYIVSLPTSTGFLPEQQRYTSSHCPSQQGFCQSNSVIHRLIANLNRVPARATALYIVSLPTSTGFLPEQQRYTSSHCPSQQGSCQSNSVIHRLIANLNRVPPRATALYIVSLPISTGFLPEQQRYASSHCPSQQGSCQSNSVMHCLIAHLNRVPARATALCIVSLPISTGFLPEQQRYTSSHCPSQQGSCQSNSVMHRLIAHLNRVPPRATALYIVSLPISTGFLPEQQRYASSHCPSQQGSCQSNSVMHRLIAHLNRVSARATALYVVSLPISTGFLPEQQHYTSSHCPSQQGFCQSNSVMHCLIAHLNRVPARATALYVVSLPISTGFLPEQQRYTSSHCPSQQGSCQSNSVMHRLIAHLNRVPARAW